jgi:hypothetical protein
MDIPGVSLDVWHNLYQNSLRFQELRPWETLYDSDHFGVRDPITGQIGYCRVMSGLALKLILAWQGRRFQLILRTAPAASCLMTSVTFGISYRRDINGSAGPGAQKNSEGSRTRSKRAS